jgi:ferredoxin-fold anticodon binding domain-containing protein
VSVGLIHKYSDNLSVLERSGKKKLKTEVEQVFVLVASNDVEFQ